jgi:hypothetical protein
MTEVVNGESEQMDFIAEAAVTHFITDAGMKTLSGFSV